MATINAPRLQQTTYNEQQTSRMFHEYQLDNGLRIVIEVMPHVRSVACGFLARTGARDDPAELAGVSHFLEHMCFKGTQRRTWNDVNTAFDELGSQYNAYTTKDRTFYYGWVRSEDFERQLELLADLMRPTLPDSEFQMERGVVLEEIAMSEDDLASCAYDFLFDMLNKDAFYCHELTWCCLTAGGIDVPVPGRFVTADCLRGVCEEVYEAP